MTDAPVRLTIPELRRRKAAGEKVVMISAADYAMARWAERAGADMVVVGDSLAMTSHGMPDTLGLTVDLMVAHTRAVRRGAPNLFCLAAMPYGSYGAETQAVETAFRLMKDGGADAVKLQGGRARAPILRAVADAGIPVMGHVGMCPHLMHFYGGFKLQGRSAEEAAAILDDALAVQAAGAIGVEIEAIPAPVARAIDARLDIFTFGVGAGPDCCGQILLGADMLGAFDAFKPKFAKRYADIGSLAVEAFSRFAQEVRDGAFPDAAHSYAMKPEEEERLARLLDERAAQA